MLLQEWALVKEPPWRVPNSTSLAMLPMWKKWRQMKTRLQPVVCWFWGFNGFNRFSHLFECPFFNTLWCILKLPGNLESMTSFLSFHIFVSQKPGLASRQRPQPRPCSKGWSWSGRGHRPLAWYWRGRRNRWQVSWLHDLQVVEILDVMKTICITMYYLWVYVLYRYWDGITMQNSIGNCQRCVHSVWTVQAPEVYDFGSHSSNPGHNRSVGQAMKGKAKSWALTPCLCTGNMQNMAQIGSKCHVSPGKPWKKWNFDWLLLEWCHLTSL